MITRTVRWTGHDDEGNTVTGTVPVQVSPPILACPIDPADGRDVTAELTAWLLTVPAGAIADLGGKAYRSETAVRLDDRRGLTIRNGTLYRTDRATHGGVVYPTANPQLWLMRPVSCRLENLTFRGTNDVADQRAGFGAYKVDYEFEAAIRLEAFTDCAVTGLDVDAVWGDGVQWQKGSGAYMADCRIDRIGRQGVGIVGSNFLIERVRIEHGRRGGFDLEPDLPSQVFENFEIRNCYTNTIGLPFPSAGRGKVNNVWIHHNTSQGGSVPLLYVKASDGAYRENWRFEDHVALTSLGSPSPAVLFARVSNFAVRRVRLPVAVGQSRLALGLTECGGTVEFTGNDTTPAGDRYFNRTPLADQQLVISGNTMPLTQVA